MDELMRELYQETIMGHNRSPKNFRAMENSTSKSLGHNPLCGDKLVVYLHVDAGVVTDVSFEGDGCAISKASASMMSEAVKGKSEDDAKIMYEQFHHLVTRDALADEEILGKLRVFAGVGEFPARVKCAALPWRTMAAALESEQEVSTE